jgi:hypothetical protein
LTNRQIGPKSETGIDSLRAKPVNEFFLVSFSYAATQPLAVVIKFQHTIIAKFTVNRPWGPVNLTLGAKFNWFGLVGENVGFWRF